MRTLRALARLAVLSTGTAVVLLPGTAHASVIANGCGANGATGIYVNVLDTVVISIDPATGQIRVNGSPCTKAGPTAATTNNIDSIAISANSGSTVTIDQSNGKRFAPGSASDANGLASILFTTSSSDPNYNLVVNGTAGDDMLSVGPEAIVHLDTDGDGDIVGAVVPASITLNGLAGNDLISGGSLSAFLPNDSAPPVTLNGGLGDDVLTGGKADDVINGGDGHDTITGGDGNDTIDGGPGDDRISDAQTRQERPYGLPATLTDGSSAQSTVNANYPNALGRIVALRVAVTLTEPNLTGVTVALSNPSGQSVTLASGLTGAHLRGVAFEDLAPTSISSGTAPYTGRFRPASGTLASLLPGGYGAWTLTVTETATDAIAPVLSGFTIQAVGTPVVSPETGVDTTVGGTGTDSLSFAGWEGFGRTFRTSSATAGVIEAQDFDGSVNTYSQVEQLIGSAGHDVFFGSTGDDFFNGLEGDEVIFEGGGNDTFLCGEGTDLISYQGASPGVTVDLSVDPATTSGGGGTDALTACDSVRGTSGDDSVTASSRGGGTFDLVGGNDSFTGGSGADTVTPGSGFDTIATGAGDDRVLLAPDASPGESMSGGANVDTVDYSGAYDPLSVSLDGVANDGSSTDLDALAGDFENIRGGQAADRLDGNTGPNWIEGWSGADVIDGHGGEDFIFGGDAQFDSTGFEDTFSAASWSAGADINLATGRAELGLAVTNLSDFTHVIGSPHSDVIVGNDAANTIRPGLGNDTVNGQGEADRFVAEPGPDGADTWIGGTGASTVDYSLRTAGVQLANDDAANDGALEEDDNIGSGNAILLGGLSHDILIGGAAADDLRGGAGNDELNGRGGEDTVDGGAGNDTVNGGSSGDTLTGGVGDDVMLGGDGDDLVRGGVGNDRLYGGLGDDDAYGEDGNDRFEEGDSPTPNGSDLLVGGAGTDIASYFGRMAGVSMSRDGRFNDGRGEQDNIAVDIEVLDATNSDDVLTGNRLHPDRLIGQGGNDRLTGLAGNDRLEGGSGNDAFIFDATTDGADSVSGGTGIDHADYRARTAGIAVRLDNLGNDGASGEGDNILSDVENVSGGAGNDTLFGSTAINALAGGAGNDTFYGNGDGKRDVLNGGTGTDRARRDAIDSVTLIEAFF